MRPPENLSEAEERLRAAVRDGERAYFTVGDPERDNPAGGTAWGSDRTLRAEVIRALCVGMWPDMKIDPKGIRIIGARVVGTFDLEAVTLAFPLRLMHCYFENEPTFVGAAVKLLDFSGTYLTGGLNAEGLKVAADAFLRTGFTANGRVSFRNAEIKGSFHCAGARFVNPGGAALSATGTEFGGNVFLGGASAEGGVTLDWARIGGSLHCADARFVNPGGDALSATGIEIRGPVFLNLASEGGVFLYRAKIGGNLDCSGGRFVNAGGPALTISNGEIGGFVFLNDAASEGEVRLIGTRIGGSLHVTKAHLVNRGGDALDAAGAEIRDDVVLRNTSAEGQVSVSSARIVGDLNCADARFANPGSVALSASRADIGGNVDIANGFAADGEVFLYRAKIGGDLDCTGGRFANPGRRALTGVGAEIGGDVSFGKGFAAEGRVRLIGARIGGDLECVDARFAHEQGIALDLEGAQVAGRFSWFGIDVQGTVDLGHTRVSRLADDVEGWPQRGRLLVDGFEYDGFAGGAAVTAKERLAWLERQPEFRPQPYEHLARVLRHLGHERDARAVAIAKQEALRKSGQLPFSARVWSRFLGLTVAHGYKPWRALWLALSVVALGWVAFFAADRAAIMIPSRAATYAGTPVPSAGGTHVQAAADFAGAAADRLAVIATEEAVPAAPLIPSEERRQVRSDYPPFVAPLYSLDVFLPVVNLHQEDYWLPNKSKEPFGLACWAYMWFHILAGWTLTTVLIAALTGLIKRD